MKQKFGKGVSVKIKNGYRIPLTQARPTYSAFIMNVPAGPWAGASDLHLEAGAVGEIDSIAHGEFQGWYIVKFPITNSIYLTGDFEQDDLEEA